VDINISIKVDGTFVRRPTKILDLIGEPILQIGNFLDSVKECRICFNRSKKSGGDVRATVDNTSGGLFSFA
jgi:hypothetical protein